MFKTLFVMFLALFVGSQAAPGLLGYGLSPIGPVAAPGTLQTLPNGATVPVEPLANQVARAQHLNAKFATYARYGYGPVLLG